MIAVPAGLGLLGAILYALFWSISIYLMGAVGGLALALYILCCKENLVISQVSHRGRVGIGVGTDRCLGTREGGTAGRLACLFLIHHILCRTLRAALFICLSWFLSFHGRC